VAAFSFDLAGAAGGSIEAAMPAARQPKTALSRVPAPVSAPAPQAPPTSNWGRTFVVLLFVAALVGVPLLVIYGSTWFGMYRAVPGDDRPLPQWITPGEVRSTTSDGAIMKLRVSLDAATWSNRQAIEHRMMPITQVLRVSAGARRADELVGAKGVEQLSKDLLVSVNAYLDAEGLKPLNGLAVQDLWYTRPR
jgi:flagellar basal body-associated protein FliL